MIQQIEWQVTPSCEGMTLKDFLRSKKVSASLRAAVKRNGGFLSEGRLILPHEKVAAGQRITMPLPEEPPVGVTPQNLPLRIVYESEQVMVLEKPAGMTIHPTMGFSEGTLANAFCGEMKRRGEVRPFRPMNRLDRETSGLVVCAMNTYAAAWLHKQTEKIYYAVVHGAPHPAKGDWNMPIRRCEDSIIKRCCAEDGKPSLTHYRVLYEEADGRCALVECRLETGRTHQIRVHASFFGYPLCGDDLYGAPPGAMQRVALHCGQVAFCEPVTEQAIVVKSPLPEDIRLLLLGFGAKESALIPDFGKALL